MNFLGGYRPKFAVPLPQPRWLVVWGAMERVDLDCAVWCDASPTAEVQFAIVQAANWAMSPRQRWVVVGDLWLSNRREMLMRLSVDEVSSDLALVAHLWEQFGWESLQLIQGMFGLAIWDRELQELRVVRDAVGARTVYYTEQGATRWLAGQQSVLQPYRSNQLDLTALRDYLTCAFIPGERTLWQDVRELRPGTILQFPGEISTHYWQLQERINHQKSLVEQGQDLRLLLVQVVADYLPTAEPVGVFLSGGLDSSCITALAAQLHSAPVHTYSIHFGAETPHELEFSGLIAAHCQTHHHILEITWQDMWDQLPTTLAELDDPIGDPLTVPNLLLGKLARQDVRVTLNGEGGDPCFGGPKNQPMLIDRLYQSVVNQSVTGQDALQAYLVSFQKCAADLPQLLRPEVWQQMQQPWVFTADLNSEMTYLNRLMALNIKFKGADQILTKVNNLTHAVGLQGRSPLFDQRVVELSMQMPAEYKLSGVQEKAVLKQAVADLLPRAIIDRPKSGMMVPVQLGFRKYWQRQARSLLLSRRALIAPYVNQAIIKDWLNFRGDVWGRYGVKLWLLVSLEIWLQVHMAKRR